MANTTQDKLSHLVETKAQIKEAIVSQGVSVPANTAFRTYANLIRSIDTSAKIFRTVEEMEAYSGVPEVSIAIIYDLNYEAIYKYENGEWVYLGGPGDNVQAMINLNLTSGVEDEYDGLGGTEAEVINVLDTIIGGNV